MSLSNNRRALIVAGLTGMLLAGGALATSSAAHADEVPSWDGIAATGGDDTAGSSSADGDTTDSGGDTAITLDEAVGAAQGEYPGCDVTAALFYDTGDTSTWDVELTCDSGTVKYVTVDAADGSIVKTGSNTDDVDADASDDTSDADTDPNDASGTGANADYDS